MATTKPVTDDEIAAAVQALKLNTPVRRAERKGASIVLYTRSGVFTYTPTQPGTRKKKTAA